MNGLALYAATKLLSGLQYTGGLKFFVIGGIVIGVLNTFVKPLMKLLSFPIVLLTAGVFSFFINVIIFWLMVKIVNIVSFSDVSVKISDFWIYFAAAFVFAVTNWILHLLIRNK